MVEQGMSAEKYVCILMLLEHFSKHYSCKDKYKEFAFIEEAPQRNEQLVHCATV